ncbi:ribonuclease III domain-containing protein [Phormidesmis sp. 146-35]
MTYKLNIKLEAAKQALALPDFQRDDLLRLALTDLSTLQLPSVLASERQAIVLQYRRLAFLGDRLLDAILADYLFETHLSLTNQDLDDWRQNITCRESLTKFAIALGLPNFCSSWNKPNRRPPETEPGIYGEMFEALVAVIYLDSNRNFEKVYQWVRDRFIREIVGRDEENFELKEDFNVSITTEDYLEMIGLEGFSEHWAPGDDDD